MVSKLIPSLLGFLLYMLIRRVLLRTNVPKLLSYYYLCLTQNSQICLAFHLLSCEGDLHPFEHLGEIH